MFRRSVVLIAAALLPLAMLSCTDHPTDQGPEVQAQLARGGNGKPKPNPSFEVTGFDVEKMAPGTAPANQPISANETVLAGVRAIVAEMGLDSNYFGCPEVSKVCNKITMEFLGNLEAFRFTVAHDAGALFYEDDLTDPTHAANHWTSAAPALDMTGVTSPLIIYWQGQRRVREWDATNEVSIYHWSVYPDLDVVGIAPDRFVFSCSYLTAGGGMMCGRGTFADYPTGFAEYAGLDRGERAFVVIDEIELVTQGGSTKPKKNAAPPSTHITFDVQAFGPFDPLQDAPFDVSPNYLAEETLAASIETNFRPVITKPNGEKTVIISWSSGANPDSETKPNIEQQRFGFGPFTDGGCYVIDLLGAFVYDHSARNTVWERAADTGYMAKPIWINYVANNPTASTSGRGDTCPIV